MGPIDPGSLQLKLPVAKAVEAQVQGIGVGSLRSQTARLPPPPPPLTYHPQPSQSLPQSPPL